MLFAAGAVSDFFRRFPGMRNQISVRQQSEKSGPGKEQERAADLYSLLLSRGALCREMAAKQERRCSGSPLLLNG